MKRILCLLGLTAALPVFAQAIGEPGSVEQAVGMLPILVNFAKAGNWLMFGAALSLLLTFAIKKYVLPKVGLGNGVLPLVSIVLGVVAGVGAAVLGGASVQAATLAVLSGPLASSLWDALFQYFFKKDA